MQLQRPIDPSGDAALVLHMRCGAAVTIECSWDRCSEHARYEMNFIFQIALLLCCSELLCLCDESYSGRDQNSFQIVGDKGHVSSSEWWGRCAALKPFVCFACLLFSPTSLINPRIRDFTGNFQIETNGAQPPISPQLQRVNVYATPFSNNIGLTLCPGTTCSSRTVPPVCCTCVALTFPLPLTRCPASYLAAAAPQL